ncbi:MAG: hypothetical protein ACYC99_04250 [Candidatus Geothermincolia bacterium]
MEKFLAHKAYAWLSFLGAKATAGIGLVAAIRDKDILGMDADDWFMLSLLYMVFIVASLLARLVLGQERAAA